MMGAGEVNIEERTLMTMQEYSVLNEVLEYHECGWSYGGAMAWIWSGDAPCPRALRCCVEWRAEPVWLSELTTSQQMILLLTVCYYYCCKLIDHLAQKILLWCVHLNFVTGFPYRVLIINYIYAPVRNFHGRFD
jgi:hypothetical protein